MSEKSAAVLGAEKIGIPEVSLDLEDLVWTRGCDGACTGAGRLSSLETMSSMKSSEEEDISRTLGSEILKIYRFRVGIV